MPAPAGPLAPPAPTVGSEGSEPESRTPVPAPTAPAALRDARVQQTTAVPTAPLVITALSGAVPTAQQPEPARVTAKPATGSDSAPVQAPADAATNSEVTPATPEQPEIPPSLMPAPAFAALPTQAVNASSAAPPPVPQTESTQPLSLPTPAGAGEARSVARPVAKPRTAPALPANGPAAAVGNDREGVLPTPALASASIAPLPGDAAQPTQPPGDAQATVARTDIAPQATAPMTMPLANVALPVAPAPTPTPTPIGIPPATASDTSASAAPLASPNTRHVQAAPSGDAGPAAPQSFAQHVAAVQASADPIPVAPAPGDGPAPLPGTAAPVAVPDRVQPPAPAQEVRHLPVVSARPGAMGHEVGVEIARQTVLGNEHVTIRLDPGTMGRIEVRMHFDDRGNLNAVVAAESPAALELLKRESGDLGRALSDAGVKTDSGSFRFDSRSSGSDGGSGWQRQQNGHNSPNARGYAEATPPNEEPAYRALPTSGSVDLMA